HDRRLRGADWAMQQQHALLGAVALSGALEEIDQPHQRDLETKDGVVLIERRVAKELVANQALLGIYELLSAKRHDHVVDSLERIPRYMGILCDNVQVLTERARPV